MPTLLRKKRMRRRRAALPGKPKRRRRSRDDVRRSTGKSARSRSARKRRFWPRRGRAGARRSRNPAFRDVGQSPAPGLELAPGFGDASPAAPPEPESVAAEDARRPVGFYAGPAEWLRAAGLESAGHYREYYGGYRYAYRDADWLGDPVPPNFRPLESVSAPAYVATVPNGRLWGRGGAVITEDGRLLSDVSVEYDGDLVLGERHSVFTRWQPFPLRRIRGTAAVLTFCGSENYFHWLFDVLPRLHLLRLHGEPIDAYVINRNGNRPFQEETLRMLGLDPARIVETDDAFHAAADRLLVPSLVMWSEYPKWATDFVRGELLRSADAEEPPSGSGVRLYISRAGAQARRVANEPEVVELLQSRGFIVTDLLSMTVREQVRLFRSAEAVVAPHGAGLANLAFCRPGAKVIELFAPDYVPKHYWLIGNHVGLDYYCCLGGGVPRAGGHHHDLVVDPVKLAGALKAAGL
ncbi:glycosyltransferase family 61 protein [Paenibacillus flagellatus]|nr:glycosyltransferase family 61 protein [Paenibacillus flagellatus]